MLKIESKKNIKVISMEGYSDRGPLVITATAEKVVGCKLLEVNIEVSHPDSFVAISCGTVLTDKVDFTDCGLETFVFDLLEDNGDEIVEVYYARLAQITDGEGDNAYEI